MLEVLLIQCTELVRASVSKLSPSPPTVPGMLGSQATSFTMNLFISSFVVQNRIHLLEAGEGHVDACSLLPLPAVLGTPVGILIPARLVDEGNLSRIQG